MYLFSMSTQVIEIDLKGLRCPHGTTIAIEKIREVPLNTEIELILDDNECFNVLRRILPLIGQKVISWKIELNARI